MAACQRYREATRRRIFIEYLLLDGVNDAPGLADELADLLHGTAPGGFHVNLIVYNPTDSADFRASGALAGRGVPRPRSTAEDRPLPAPVARSRHRRGLRPARGEGRARSRGPRAGRRLERRQHLADEQLERRLLGGVRATVVEP